MKITKTLAILAIATQSYISFAQETAHDSIKKSNQLDEVKIESHRYSKNNTQLKTISQEQIEFGNFQTTAELLSNSGNLFVQKSQQGGGSPVIRGLESNRVLLLVDGVRMNNLIFRGGHLQNIITVDENMLEKADILFGTYSTPFGSDALGGAINLITKSPLTKSENKNRFLSGNINTRYGTVNEEKSIYGSLNFSGEKWGSLTAFSFNDFGDVKMGSKPNGDNPLFGERKQYIETVQYMDNGILKYEDRIITNENPLIQKFSGYKQYNAMQKFVYRPNSTTEHKINLQFSTTTDIPRYDRLTDIKNGNLKTATWNYGPQKRILAGYKFSKDKFILNSDFTVNINYQNAEESRITRDYKKVDEISRIEKVNVYSISADLKAKLGNGELLYGVDIFYDDLKSTANARNINTNAISVATTRYPDGINNTLKADIFATYFANINENTKYNIGLRGGYASLNSSIDNNLFNLPFNTIKQTNFTYSATAGITNNTTKSVKLSFNVSTGFRVPNIDDLAKIFESSKGTLIVPNSDLKPEKNITTDFNITLTDNNYISFENGVFYTQLLDAIVTDSFTFNGTDTILYEGTQSKVMANQNLGKATIFGYSTALKINITKNLKFVGNYNFTYGRLHATSKTPNRPLDHIPPQYGKLGLNFNNKWLEAEANMLYNSKKHINDYLLNAEDNEQYAPPGGMPAWQTYNFKTSFKFIKSLTLYAGVENILDTQYRTFASGINAPGRNLYSGLKYQF